MAQAEMAAVNLDVLGLRPGDVEAACHAQMPSLRLKIEVVGTGGASASESGQQFVL